MSGFVDPQSELVKAIMARKAGRLAQEGFERLIQEGEDGGLDADEVMSICHRVIAEAPEIGNRQVFTLMHEAVIDAIESRRRGEI
jgi:hypothetical protein